MTSSVGFVILCHQVAGKVEQEHSENLQLEPKLQLLGLLFVRKQISTRRRFDARTKKTKKTSYLSSMVAALKTSWYHVTSCVICGNKMHRRRTKWPRNVRKSTLLPDSDLWVKAMANNDTRHKLSKQQKTLSRKSNYRIVTAKQAKMDGLNSTSGNTFSFFNNNSTFTPWKNHSPALDRYRYTD